MSCVQLDGVLKSRDSLGKLPGLQMRRAEEVPGVGVVAVDLGDVLKGINCLFQIAAVLVKQAQVVPCGWILWIVFDDFVEQHLGVIHTLKVQQRDGPVETRQTKFWIRGEGGFKILQRLLKQLLVHVGGTQVILAHSFPRSLGIGCRLVGKRAKEGHSNNGGKNGGEKRG